MATYIVYFVTCNEVDYVCSHRLHIDPTAEIYRVGWGL